MPDYMMEQILAGEDTVSAKEILEAKKAWWDNEGTKAYHRLLNHFKGDSLRPADEDSLNWLFAFRNTLEAQYDKIGWLHAKGDYNHADSLLTILHELFSLTPSQLEVHHAYIDLYPLLEHMRTDTLSVFGVDSTLAASLLEITTSNDDVPGAYARNLLIAAGKATYQEPVILPDSSLKQAKKTKFRGVEESGDASVLTVYPNPAHDYFVVKINLDTFTGQGVIKLFDGNGKIVQAQSFSGRKDQVIIPTTDLITGFYLLVLEVGGKQSGSMKIAVIK